MSWRSGSKTTGQGDGYPGFEDVFRGTFEFIKDRQRVYLDELIGQAPVLDFGCGRGEMLELLKDAGIEAVGVDQDEDQIARCRARGLDAVCSDGLDHLSGVADGSLGALFSSQVIEHLELDEIERLPELGFREAAR